MIEKTCIIYAHICLYRLDEIAARTWWTISNRDTSHLSLFNYQNIRLGGMQSSWFCIKKAEHDETTPTMTNGETLVTVEGWSITLSRHVPSHLKSHNEWHVSLLHQTSYTIFSATGWGHTCTSDLVTFWPLTIATNIDHPRVFSFGSQW